MLLLIWTTGIPWTTQKLVPKPLRMQYRQLLFFVYIYTHTPIGTSLFLSKCMWTWQPAQTHGKVRYSTCWGNSVLLHICRQDTSAISSALDFPPIAFPFMSYLKVLRSLMGQKGLTSVQFCLCSKAEQAAQALTEFHCSLSRNWYILKKLVPFYMTWELFCNLFICVNRSLAGKLKITESAFRTFLIG